MWTYYCYHPLDEVKLLTSHSKTPYVLLTTLSILPTTATEINMCFSGALFSIRDSHAFPYDFRALTSDLLIFIFQDLVYQ